MINLKSGDFVGYNNQVFWVCRCADNPLNLLRSPSCKWCDMLRPTDAAQQSAQADFPPVARKKELCFVCGRVGCRKGH